MSETSARGPEAVRSALIEAAKSFLPARAPSTVSGRELAERAGVNYGLVYHYFGGKDAVFREAMLSLRDDFLQDMGEPGRLPLITNQPHPYILAIGRSMMDYPIELGPFRDFPIGNSVVQALVDRLGGDHDEAEARIEAKARAVALLSMQLGYGLFRTLLLDTVGVPDDERAEVETILTQLHRELAAAEQPAPR